MLFQSEYPKKTEERLSSFRLRNTRSSISHFSEDPDPLQPPSLSNATTNKKYINLLFQNKVASSKILTVMFVAFLTTSLIILVVGLVFFVIAMINIRDQKFLEIGIQYYRKNNQILCQVGQTCSFNFTISESQYAALQGETIFMSYMVDGNLQNVYANGYTTSFSRKQLAGFDLTEEELSDKCGKEYYLNGQLNKTVSKQGGELVKNKVANPCGLIAAHFNNDTFRIFKTEEIATNTSEVEFVSDQKILWPEYLNTHYRDSQTADQMQWISHTQPHFVAWMTARGLPRTKILWGSIKQDLLPGNYTLEVTLNYNSTLWTGDRFFYLQSQQIYNGRFLLLPIMFMVVGVIGIIGAIIIFWKLRKIEEDSEQQ